MNTITNVMVGTYRRAYFVEAFFDVFFSFFRSSFLNLVVERNTQRHRRLTKTPMHTMFINSFSIASHRMIERDRAEAIKDKRETKFMEKKKKAQKTCSN